MGIKNDSLGGTDWASTDYAVYSDFNDTFDALFNHMIANSMFWNNSTISTIYDDFASGTSIDTADWDLSGSGTHTEEQVASANAGGNANEAHVYANADSVPTNSVSEIQSKNIPANCNVYVRLHGAINITDNGSSASAGSATLQVGIKTGASTFTYYTVSTITANPNGSGTFGYTFKTDVKFINTAPDTYDVFVGGYKFGSDITVNSGDPQISFRAAATTGLSSGQAHWYIDDVTYSNIAT